MNADPTATDAPAPSDPPPPSASQASPVDLLGLGGESETFQHYQVLRRPDGRLWELGRGAMGVTYKAFDTNLRCQVALKVISAQHLHSEVAGQRFIREARVAAQLRHRNIATVYHLGVDPNGFFYSMEFIDGETLEALVSRTGPLPLDTVLRVALQTSRALAAAARQGLIHRDIKPANLMILHKDEDGEDELLVKVIDFGLARSYEADASNAALTATGFVGTPLYASPEQLEERDLDARSDIYSLGVTMWILLTGHPPFEGKMTQVITQHLSAEPPWRQLGEIPEPARALLERMLRKDPAERFQNAVDLRVAIEGCLRGLTGRDEALPGEGSDVSVATNPAVASVGAVDRERRETRAKAEETVAWAEPPAPVPAAVRAKPAGGRGWLTGSRALLAGATAIFLCALGFAAWRGWSSQQRTGAGMPRASAASPRATVVAAETPNRATTEPVVAPETPPPALAEMSVSTPPPAVSPAVATDAGDDLTASPTVPAGTMAGSAMPTPTPAASPAVAQTASADDGDDDENVDNDDAVNKSSKNPKVSQRTRARRGGRRKATPAPNFFQKLFGIKPKPKPRSR